MNPANWTFNSIPGLGNTMTINNGNLAHYPVLTTNRSITQSNISAGSLTVNATLSTNMSISGSGFVAVNTGGALTGTITVGNSGTLCTSQNLGAGTNLRVNGTGVGGLGALRSVGNVAISNPITLLGNTQIRSETGILDLGSISGNGFNLTASGNGSIRFNDPINIGSGTLTLNGSATSAFALLGTNTFTGPIQVNGGSLQVSGGNNVINDNTRVILASGTFLQVFASERIGGLEGSGTVAIGANQTFTFGSAQDHTFSGAIITSGIGLHNITKEGAGTQILNGFVQHDGETRINAGKLQLGDGSQSLSFSATGPIVNNAALEFNHSGFMSIVGAISGTGSVTTRGTGVTVLRALNTYAGPTTIAGGALRANLSNAFSAASAVSITAANASLDLGGFNQTIGSLSGIASSIVRNGVSGNSTLTTGGNNTSTTFSGLMQNGFGTLALVKTGTGNFTLAGSNTYTGGTTIQAGSITAGNAGSIGTGTLTVGGGASYIADYTGTLSNQVRIVAGQTGIVSAATGRTLTLSGNLDPQAGSTLQLGSATAAGTIILAPSGWAIDPASNIVFQSGTTQLGNATAANLINLVGFLGTGSIALNGTLDLNGNNVTLRRLSGAGTLATSTGAATANLISMNGFSGTFDTAGNRLTLTGALSGNANLTKTGTGTLVLASDLVTTGHTGGLRLMSGTLSLQTGLAASFGAIRTSGSVVDYAAGITNAAPIDIDSNTTQLQVLTGTATQSGVISQTGGVRGFEKIGAGTLVLTGNNTYQGTTTISGGQLSVANTNNLGADSATNSLIFNGGSLLLTGAIDMVRPVVVTALGGTVDTGTGFHRWNGGITLTGRLAKTGTGTLNLNAAGVGAGGIDLRGGEIQLRLGSSMGTGSLAMNEGTSIRVSSLGQTFTNDITLGGGTGSTINYLNTTLSGVLSGGRLNVNALDASNGALILLGNNTYDQTFVANNRALRIGNGGITGTLGTGAVTLSNAGSSLVFNRSNDFEVTNAIGGGGIVIQQGTGRLTLSGANSYTGGTQIVSGVLVAGANGAVGTSQVLLGNGALVLGNGVGLGNTVSITANSNSVVAAATGGIGTLSGTLLVGNNSTLRFGSGTDAGTLLLNIAGNSQIVGSANVSFDGGTTRIGNANAASYLNLFAISGGLSTIGAAATVDVNGNNWTATNLNALGTLANSGGNATITLVNPLNFTGTVNSGPNQLTLTGSLSGSTAITKTGTGTLVLSAGLNTLPHTGGLILSQGTLALQNGLGAGFGTIRTDGSVIDYGNGINNAAAIQINSNTTQLQVTAGNATQSGVISQLGGVRGFEKIGAGTLVLTGVNSYAGTTTVSGGALSISNTNHLGSNTAGNNLILNGGGLTTTGTMAFTRELQVTAAGGTLSLGNNLVILNGASTFTGRLVKNGTGILVLSGTGSGAGGIDMRAGAIQVQTASSLGTGDLIMAAGTGLSIAAADLTLANNITLGGAVGSTISTQSSTLTGVLSGGNLNVVGGSGSLTLTGANTYTNTRVDPAIELRIGNGGTSGRLGTGTVTLAAGTSTLTFNRSDAITVGNEISGTGSLRQEGTGTVILTGDSSGFNGTTTISSGTLQIGAGGVSGALGNGNIVNNAALVFNRSNDLTASNVISGGGTLTKQGTGTLTLSGANNYEGVTTVAEGTLVISNATALGTTAGNTVVASGATLQSQLNSTLSEAITINGTGIGNGGALIVNANTTLSGAITLGSASRITASGSQMTISGGISGTNHDLTINTGDNLTVSSALSLGTGNLIKEGSRNLILTGNNTYGTTTINAGQITIGNGAATGNLGSGNVVNNSSLVFDRSDDIVVGNTISGTGSVSKQTTTGTLTLTGNNDYSGGTRMFGGRIAVGSNRALGTGIFVSQGGTLQLGIATTPGVSAGPITMDNNINLVANTTIDLVGLLGSVNEFNGNYSSSGTAATLNGVIRGGSRLTVVGGGTLTLNGNNIYSGGSSVSQALVQVGHANAFGTGSVTLGGVAGLRNTTGGALTLGNAISVDGPGVTIGGTSNFTLTGNLSGNGSLFKVQGNTLAIDSAVNDFSGLLTINGGTALVNGTMGNAGARVIVNNNGTLGGTGTIVGQAVINAGANLAPGQSPGTLTFGSLTLNAGSNTTFELGTAGVVGGPTNDLIRVTSTAGPGATGALTLNGGNISITRGAGFGSGLYTLIAFDGLLTGLVSNLTLNPLGGGYQGNLALNPGAVVLNVANNVDNVWWNGSTLAPTGQVQGGSGTWNLVNGNFSNAAGTQSGGWAGNGAMAIFGGLTGGTVTIAAGTTVAPSGINFLTDGYLITGGDAASRLSIAGATGIQSASGVNATISAVISGAGSITKSGAGTLTLSGANTYSGLTTVIAGTLLNSGTIAGGVSNSAGFTSTGTVQGGLTNAPGGAVANIAGNISGAIDNSSVLTFTGNTTAAGTLTNNASGLVLVAAGANVTGLTGVTNSGSATDAFVINGALGSSGSFTNLTGSRLTVGTGGSLSATLSLFNSASAIVTNAGTINSGIANSGTVNSTGTLTSTLNNLAGGIANISGTAASITNSGTVTVTGNLNLTGTYINEGTGFTTIAQGQTLTTNSSISHTSSSANGFVINGQLVTTAGMTVGANSQLLISDTGSVQNGNMLNGLNGSTITNAGRISGAVTTAGLLVSTGQLLGGLTMDLGGEARISGTLNGIVNAPGLLTITGHTTSDGSLVSTGLAGRIIVNAGAIWSGAGLLNLSGSQPESMLVNGTLSLAAGQRIEITGSTAARVAFGGAFTTTAPFTSIGLSLGSNGTFINQGTASAYLSADGAVTNGGTWTGSAEINAPGVLTNTGTWDASGTGGFVRVSGRVDNSGTFRGPLTVTGAGPATGLFVNLATGIVDTGTAGTAITNDGTIQNAGNWTGAINIGGGGLLGNGQLTNTGTANGLVTNNAGSILTSSGSLLAGLVNRGTASLSGTISGAVDNTGVLTFTGNTNHNSNLTNSAAGIVTVNAGVSIASTLTGSDTGLVTNNGTWTGDATTSGSLTNAATGIWNGAVTAQAGGNVQNLGLVNGSLNILALGSGSSSGTITGLVSNAGIFASTGTLAAGLTNTGFANLAGTVSGSVFNGGAIALTGSTTGIGAVTQSSAGSFALGGFSATIGSLSGSGSVVLGTATLTTGGDNSSTSFAGVIEGAGGLTKTGAGTFTLSGANSYAGLTRVSQGVLSVRRNGALGTSAGGTVIDAGAGLELLGGLTITGEALTINGTGMSGAGALRNVADNNIWAGTVTLGSDSLIMADAGRLDIDLLAGTTQALTTGGAGQIGLANATTSGTLTVTGGNLTLLGSGIFASGVNVNAGNLFLQGGNSIADAAAVTLVSGNLIVAASETIGSLAGSGGTVQINAGQTLTLGGNSLSTVFSGATTGAGSLIKTGTGSLALNRAINHTGLTTVAAGTLNLASDGAMAGAVLNNATVTNAGAIAGLVTNAGNLTSSGALGGGLVNNGGGIVLLSGRLDGAVSNAGTITLAGVTTGIDTLVQSGGILNVAGFSTSIGSLGGTGSVQLGSGTLTVGSNGLTTSFNGTIAGSGALTKTGSGTLTLSGNMAHTGLTTVNAGSLILAADTTLAGGVQNNAGFTNNGNVQGLVTNTGTLRSSGTLSGGLINDTGGLVEVSGVWNGSVSNAGTLRLSGFVSGNVAFTQSGAGVFDLAGSTGVIGSLAGSGSVLLGSGTLVVGRSDTSTSFAGNISGTGGIEKEGTGSFTLTGVNTFTGPALVSGGTLALASGASLAGPVTNNAVFTNAGLVTGGVTNNGTLVSTGTLSGGLSNNATGTASLSGAFSGNLINRGTVNLTGTTVGIGELSMATGAIFNLGGFATTIGNLTGGGTVALGSATLTLGSGTGSQTFDGTITGTGGITKVGASTFSLSGAQGYTGLTTVNDGTFILGSSASLAGGLLNNAIVTINGRIAGLVTNNATLQSTGALNGGLTNSAGASAQIRGILAGPVTNAGTIALTGTTTGIGAVTQASTGNFSLGGFDTSFGSLAGSGTVTLANSAVLTTGGSNASTTYAGVLTGTGAVVKTGTGTFTLSGANTLTGTLAVNAGVLALASGGSLAGPVQNAAGFNNAGTVAGLVTNTGTLVSTGALNGDLANTGSAALSGQLNGTVTNGGLVQLQGTLTGITGFIQTTTGAFNLSGFNTSIGSLAGAGNVLLDSATLTLGSSNASTSFGGTISGTGGLAKVGAGGFTLTSGQTYTGLTTVNAGLLMVAAGAGLSGSVLNNAGFGSSGLILGSLTNNGSATLAGQINGAIANNAAITASGPLIVLGRLTQNAGGTLNLAGFNASLGSLAGVGPIALGTGTLIVGSDNSTSRFAGVITGVGGLQKVGTGTLTLTGTNTYTGLTVIDGGTLVIGQAAGGTAPAPASAPVTDTGGSAVVTAVAPTAFAETTPPSTAVIAGSILNNASLINNGTVLGQLVNSAGAIATNNGIIRGAVTNRGTLTSVGTLGGGLDNSGTARISGIVTGPVINSGSITLTGTTTGITTLEQAAIGVFDLAGFDTTIGSLSGAGSVLLGNARLTTRTDGVNTLFSGVISGNGALTKVGNGALTLTGANIYAGGTTISGGILQIGNGGTTGSIVGPVLNNDTLIINRSDAVTFAGAISGSGVFVQGGTGTTTLTGANTYRGGTLISRGRLVGTTTSLQGLIQNDAALEFAQNTNGVFAGAIFGTGLLDKTGAGLLELTGDGSGLRGATTVRAGELRVTGSLANSVTTVLSGASLSGNGVIGGLVARSGSIIAPGASGLGVLGVNGAVQLQTGSTLQIQLEATQGVDAIISKGAVQIGGTAAFSNLGGVFAFNSRYVLLQTSGTRTGTFDAITGFADFGILYRPELVYTANQVVLRMAPNLLTNIVSGTPLTANQRAIVTVIDTAVTGGYNPQPLFNIYALPNAQLPGAFDQLTGEVYATTAGVGIEQERLMREAVLGRTAEVALASRKTPESGNGAGAWGQMFAGWGQGDRSANTARFESDRTGFVTGIDYGRANDEGSWRIGAYGFFMRNRVTINARGSRGDIEQAGGGLYAGFNRGGFSAAIGGSLAEVDFDATRTILLPGFAEVNRGRTDGRALQGFGELSYGVTGGKFAYRTFVNVALGSFKLDGLNETGGAAALVVARQDYNIGSVTAGVDGSLQTGRLRLSGMLAGRAQIGDRDPAARVALLAAPGDRLAISGAQLDDVALSARFDVSVAVSKKADIAVGYTGLIGSKTTDHAVRATFSVRF